MRQPDDEGEAVLSAAAAAAAAFVPARAAAVVPAGGRGAWTLEGWLVKQEQTLFKDLRWIIQAEKN